MSGANYPGPIDPAFIAVPSDNEGGNVSECSSTSTVPVDGIGPIPILGPLDGPNASLNTEQLQGDYLNRQGQFPAVGQVAAVGQTSSGPKVDAAGVGPLPIPKANPMAKSAAGPSPARPNLQLQSGQPQPAPTAPLVPGPNVAVAAAEEPPRPVSTAPLAGAWANYKPTQESIDLWKSWRPTGAPGPKVVPARPNVPFAKPAGPTSSGPTSSGPTSSGPAPGPFGPKSRHSGPKSAGPTFEAAAKPKGFGQHGTPQHSSSGECMFVPANVHDPAGFKFVVGDIPANLTEREVVFGQCGQFSSWANGVFTLRPNSETAFGPRKVSHFSSTSTLPFAGFLAGQR